MPFAIRISYPNFHGDQSLKGWSKTVCYSVMLEPIWQIRRGRFCPTFTTAGTPNFFHLLASLLFNSQKNNSQKHLFYPHKNQAQMMALMSNDGIDVTQSINCHSFKEVSQ
jgi:hypothetical protein